MSLMFRKQYRTPWRSLLLVALASATGCVVTVTTRVPECPSWSDRAIIEYDAAQGYEPAIDGDMLAEAPDYPGLDAQIGELLRVCDALKAANGERNGCDPSTWSGWSSIVLSLDCDR